MDKKAKLTLKNKIVQNMSKSGLIDIIRLIRTERVGTITFTKLIEQFGDASTAIEALPTLVKNSQKPFKICSKSVAEKEIEFAEKNNIEIIDYTSNLHPPLLKQTEGFPPILFAKGHSKLLKKSSIAIVGSRMASIVGQQNAYNFAQGLGENGFLVISGLAKGIDTSAHEGSLTRGTVAVLGCGVDIVYPKENQKLYDKIIESGLVISEFPIGSIPVAHNFPKRNRIISGISRGVLVVEASQNSGSIITAKTALDQGREVFAIPGNPADSRSRGTNALIKDGAILTESVQDILDAIKKHHIVSDNISNNFTPKRINMNDFSENELDEVRNYLMQVLSPTPVSIDTILQQNKFNYNQISIVILELELSGKLERHPNNRISLINAIK